MQELCDVSFGHARFEGMIITLFDYEKLSDTDIMIIYSHMPSERQKKFDRYRFEKEKRLCAVAYVILLYGIYMSCGTMSDVLRFEYNEYGKPYLSNYSNLKFNLSHCSTGVACVVSDSETGIDIQNADEYDKSLLDFVCSKEERQIIENHPSPDNMFTRIWTCKESYLKQIGCGINSNLAQLSFPQVQKDVFSEYGCFFSLHEHKETVITVCDQSIVRQKLIYLDARTISEFIQEFS